MARQKTETYILATGASAVSTLEKQHQLLSSLSFDQLQKAGLKEGMYVWDIGVRARFHKHAGSHLSQKMGSH